ncbi:DM13 domain-containing protein [Streptomyces sp. NPDC045431]|uniref:DM13 domain-containing protein n=1 Tax=Streptomyces sp. NPDC045431 TaxID=3155613 RepID=UPI0033FD1C05
MSRVRRRMTGPVVTGAVALVLAAAGFGLYWFQPWKLWTDATVDESAPSAVAPPPTAPPTVDPSAAATPATPAAPRTVATGSLISHEHRTSGTVRVLRLADGSHVLRLENLDTSNGPDLKVWLTDAPVREGKAGWHVFDDGAYVGLGDLKGNKGDQNYPLPAGIDPAEYTSVSIWCDRFDVSFGAAPLKKV